MITVREATGDDVHAIMEIFRASYGEHHSDARYYDPGALTKLVHSDDTVILVAEDQQSGKILGTGSVILEVGAFADLTGEFGRLAVLPEARQLGVGNLLLTERIKRVEGRLQVGVIEARAVHPYALRIAERHRFHVVGFLPLKWLVQERESLVLLVRYFGHALELRKNHPRIIPEVHSLATLAMKNCSLDSDAIVDDHTPAYPPADAFEMQEMTTEGYAPLLRIERGRVRNREIFGPMRLHYGYFMLQAKRSRYLIARQKGTIAGAIGFTLDPVEKVVRVFELISLHDPVVRFLLAELERLCREEWQICYVEIDVSAYSARMQRTLIEIGFLPVAYVPALVFHEVERLDVIKMTRLLVPPDAKTARLSPHGRRMAESVLHAFRHRRILPRIARVAETIPLFRGLSAEQLNRVAGVCAVAEFSPGAVLFHEGGTDDQLHVILSGEVEIRMDDLPDAVGLVKSGECVGEISLLTLAPHSATATARTQVETAVLKRQALTELVRLRPDIGLQIYKNLALGLGDKLQRSDFAAVWRSKTIGNDSGK
jgi:ribosomal protein S18 acetylase RimI-like enzyme